MLFCVDALISLEIFPSERLSPSVFAVISLLSVLIQPPQEGYPILRQHFNVDVLIPNAWSKQLNKNISKRLNNVRQSGTVFIGQLTYIQHHSASLRRNTKDRVTVSCGRRQLRTRSNDEKMQIHHAGVIITETFQILASHRGWNEWMRHLRQALEIRDRHRSVRKVVYFLLEMTKKF